MDPLERHHLEITRRRFFGKSLQSICNGFGVAGLSSLVNAQPASAFGRVLNLNDTKGGPGAGALGAPHFAPKAKRIIYLHMEGAPSQIDLFDYKPSLRQRYNQDLPDSVRRGQRLTGMTSGQTRFPVAPSIFKFTQYKNNADGVWISELLPNLASVSDELCMIHSMQTDAINHEPGITFFQTGNEQPGRPAFGAWMSYGLGNSNADLPCFIVMIAQGTGNMQALSARFWGSGFLSSEHQGCKLRSGSDPVLYLHDPDGLKRDDRRKMLDVVEKLNEQEYEQSLDPEIRARISQAEMAFRMQMSVPELTDFTNEDAATLDMYGPDVRKPGTMAANCLLARRLAERGVRFIQLYQRGWDQHGNLPGEIRGQAKALDQPLAALIRDLRRRGLLDETLILWASEFGRTVYSQGTLTETNYGRDHHPRCFTVWMAGGGVKPGITYGKTDEYCYNIDENPVTVHDLHATMLHLMGLDHERLIYRHLGRDYRLTDVFGKVVPALIA
ncbi:MAG: DUF1501 domain-containing protein [Planctomycetes bacterium]|nr:DUF1501 domain-containing protein [Planctomycetota bacterium]